MFSLLFMSLLLNWDKIWEVCVCDVYILSTKKCTHQFQILKTGCNSIRTCLFVTIGQGISLLLAENCKFFRSHFSQKTYIDFKSSKTVRKKLVGNQDDLILEKKNRRVVSL